LEEPLLALSFGLLRLSLQHGADDLGDRREDGDGDGG
jgi:hypothetical protein